MNINNIQKLEEIMKHYKLTFVNDVDLENLTSEIKVDFVDNDGYKYSLSYLNLYNAYKRNNNIAIFFKKNIYTIDNIRNYLKIINPTTELVSDNVSNAKEICEWKCLQHGEIFKKSWNEIKNGHYNCSKCSDVLRKKTRRQKKK